MVKSLRTVELLRSSVTVSYSYKKRKVVLLRSAHAKGKRLYSSYSFLTSALNGMSDQCHAPAAFYPRGKDARYP
jgi:hypothetical protein